MDFLQEQTRVSDMLEHVCKDDEVKTPTGADDTRNLADDDLASVADSAGCDTRRMRRILDTGNPQATRGGLYEEIAVPASDLEEPSV